MRTLVFLGLLAMSLIFLSGPALAGNAEECEFLKDKTLTDYKPGLYGLCVAWHNASSNGDQTAADQIATNFWSKSGGDDVPGSDVPGTEPDTQFPDEDPPFECPCWVALSASHLNDLGYLFDTLSPQGGPGTGLENVYSGILLLMNSAGENENFGIAPDMSACTYTIAGVGVPDDDGSLSLNFEERMTCGLEIGVIRDLTKPAE